MAGTGVRGSIGFRLAHELDGILTGIKADGYVCQSETGRLRAWLDANAKFADIKPFSELATHVELALRDGVLTPDECEDLLFVVGKYTTVNPYFDSMRAGIQSLMGLLTGVAADQVLNDRELAAMSDWVEEWSHLAGLWPYDECNAIVSAMMTSSTSLGAQYLLALSEHFPVAGAPPDSTPPLVLSGVCAVNPELHFSGREYVFTGESQRCDRAHFHGLVSTRGGVFHDNVRRSTDYLVVCADGSDYWAFSCFGRKVEKAYDMRRSGHPVRIIHEVDFWDATR